MIILYPRARDGGEADTGIAGSRLDDDGSFLQKSFLLGVVYHGLRDAILDGACGVQVLKLCKHLGP